MCDEPTDPQDNGANDSEPQDSNANASTGTGTTQDALPQDLTHLIAQFLSSVTPSDLDDFAQSFHHRPPPPSPVITSNRALQNHLIQVQLLAGIPPGQIMPMIAPLPSRRGAPPAMLQFRQDGCAMPMIPRATFNGPVMPLFTVRPETATPGCSTDGDSDGSVSIISHLIENGGINEFSMY